MEENKILSSTNNNDASYGWKFEITLVHVDRAMNVFLPRATGGRGCGLWPVVSIVSARIGTQAVSHQSAVAVRATTCVPDKMIHYQ